MLREQKAVLLQFPLPVPQRKATKISTKSSGEKCQGSLYGTCPVQLLSRFSLMHHGGEFKL